MEGAAQVLRQLDVEVIYGTIRAIRQDATSFLPWAKGDWACVIFNLRTRHTSAGRQRTAEAFRRLVDVALSLGGSFFLTYHRYATREQVLQAYPAMPAFLAAKHRHDPHDRFVSDWYHHMRSLVG
jgi:FAD/FMN-containing dehydrogenase